MARRKPPLSQVHDDRGATFTDFGGWEMPVTFDSIRIEHAAVRETAGRFDVSHMGEIEVTGSEATTLMNRLTTNDVAALTPGSAQYACITREDGVIIDDTVVYRLDDRDGEPAYLFVPNAGHDEEIESRWRTHREEWNLDASIDNVTDDLAMIAVQGPDAADIVGDAVGDAGDDTAGDDRSAVLGSATFDITEATLSGVECLIARTGYTGEDGFEILCPTADAETVWSALECQPCGLGARDTLRTEMGYLLSGQDFNPEDEPRTPYEAGVGFTVALDTDFVGRDALAAQRDAGIEQTFVGVRLLDRGVPRHGYSAVTDAGEEVGHLTSGTMSPTLSEGIGLGYLDVAYAEAGTELAIRVRGTDKRAEVTDLPFVST